MLKTKYFYQYRCEVLFKDDVTNKFQGNRRISLLLRIHADSLSSYVLSNIHKLWKRSYTPI